ncbi:GNAT family N-acetyltransferase [Eudoraea chungangensis]|uniref:GNAT family N-acetyltransferase n=1 Tax=Eudoraea chungangensis TaxID=1481905 RepID=UPI0023EAD14E|nr:GNAT family N-acetyltransferase [Eudoraea chungangensis]
MITLIENKQDWCSVIESIKDADFYHTYDYHHIAKNDNEKPYLIKFEENGHIIALPLLVRNIPGTPYKDATSVYGYPGPITNGLSSTFDNREFEIQLKGLFQLNKIVSVFSRLNAFVPYQELVLNNLGDIRVHGKIVNIDLTSDIDYQKSHYQKRLRTYINKYRRECSIRKATSQQDVKLFIEMYYENMCRVNANKNYYFPEEYFFSLIGSNSFKTDILLATDTKSGEVMGGAMFIKKNRIVQYHLAGTKNKYQSSNPLKLLLDEMRIIGSKEGYSHYNLGGGVGNKEDNLFQFKSSFSHEFRPFKLWRYITNQKVYDELVQLKKQGMCQNFVKDCGDYFPCYRCEK